MQGKKISCNKVLTLFLLSHLVIWVLVPSLSNNNLPLDTIEALAWGSDINWGYNKHPPFSAWSTEVFYQISNWFSPEHAKGIRWNDKKFNIWNKS